MNSSTEVYGLYQLFNTPSWFDIPVFSLSIKVSYSSFLLAAMFPDQRDTRHLDQSFLKSDVFWNRKRVGPFTGITL